MVGTDYKDWRNRMALPITEHPLIDVHIHSLNKKVKFRPFLVKEEKLLVLANETKDSLEMIKATQQVVTNCSFGEVDGEELPLFDMQNVFLHLRKVSISEIIESKLLCGHCEKPNDVIIDLNKFNLITGDDHQNEIRLSDSLTVEMRYPTATELESLKKAEDGESKQIYDVAASCISKLYYEDTIIDGEDFDEKSREEFIDNLESTQFVLLRQFFETMPAIEQKIEFTCRHCEKENEVFLNGYFDFFV